MEASLTLSDLDSLLSYFEDYKEEWYRIGLKLGVESEFLQTIVKTHRTDEECLKEVLKKWLTETQPATWREAERATRRSSIINRKRTSPSAEICQLLHTSPANVLPLYTGLSDSERQQLTASLQQETSDIQQKFKELITNTIERLQRCQVPLEKLIEELETSGQKGIFRQFTSIQDVFTVAASAGYWSFFNYGKLEDIVWHFNECDKIQDYNTQFRDYCKRRLRRLTSDGAAKVVMLLDNKMGLQKSDRPKLTLLRMKVSMLTGFRVPEVIWIEDCSRKPLEEEMCAEKQLDSAPTLRPPGEPHPPPQRYLCREHK